MSDPLDGPVFPPEIFDLIMAALFLPPWYRIERLDLTDEKATLASCALTCRTLYLLARRYLFGTIVCTFYDEDGDTSDLDLKSLQEYGLPLPAKQWEPRLFMFIRFLKDNPIIARTIKVLVLRQE